MNKREDQAKTVKTKRPDKQASLQLTSIFSNGNQGQVSWIYTSGDQSRTVYPDLEMAKRGIILKDDIEERIGYSKVADQYNSEGSEHQLRIKDKVGSTVALRLAQEDMPEQVAVLLINPVTHQSYLMDAVESEIELPVTEPIMNLKAVVGDRTVLKEIQEQLLPDQIQLEPNYPNPFNPITTIRYSVPEATNVQIDVFNVLGQRVQTLVSKQQQAGWHVAQFDGSQLASGMYIYRLRVGQKVLTKKMTLLK
jgi:hypothetical protein